ncbi:AAA family ATPase [Flammeovirga aprica]|uniref:AAA family ATPase n=1 Tax=Flammeovirga aprica JL-4 TaxID=694437 RepID=A0A7X9NZ50_9BACT|nr:AAA family ATPase [Flammeovirga aprica]NME66596.1 AAA family ATPase [Flammeovirga aprica JL-4]
MITKLKIQGYKSIEELELPLQSINILLGGNGVGKSNFISLFVLLRKIYQQQLQEYVAQKGGADRLFYYGKKITNSIDIDLEFGNKEGKGYNRFLLGLKPVQDEVLIHNTLTAFKPETNWHYKNYDENVRESGFRFRRDSQAYYVNDLLRTFSVYHFHDTGDNSPLKGKCRIDDNEFLQPNGNNLPAFLYFLQEKSPRSFSRIENTIKNIAPFFHHFKLKPDRINDHMIQLEWADSGNIEHYFNAYDLSDGTLRFIALTTLLLQPDPPKTIIIDEPELGLHPVAINKLSALIRKVSKKSQVIVSTQSTNFIDNFDPQDIIVVDRKNNASTFRRLEEENLKEWLEDYTLSEIWGKNIFGGQPYRF